MSLTFESRLMTLKKEGWVNTMGRKVWGLISERRKKARDYKENGLGHETKVEEGLNRDTEAGKLGYKPEGGNEVWLVKLWARNECVRN